jgi:enamine deaminase RidA (YjgF/YER057c/UK114 family)
MLRTLTSFLAASVASALSAAGTGSIEGFYLESRTCQVYTGPCFANAEFGLTGNDAIMAWHIEQGVHAGVDLSNRSVVVVLHADRTLASAGIADAKVVRSVIFVDDQADAGQREALIDFAKAQTGKAGLAVARVEPLPIQMTLDRFTLEGRLQAGNVVKMATRKAKPGDCICSNEVAYYPPLANVTNFVPGVAKEAAFSGRGLGTQWSVPDSRSVYMGLFSF